MICEICRESKVDRIIAESKKAMERYTNKLKEEKYGKSNGINSLFKPKNKTK